MMGFGNKGFFGFVNKSFFLVILDWKCNVRID